jgi:UDP-N-acetylglucosamine 2-epimerase (non-hydrolysing)
MKQIHLIAEARPSFMKIASIIDALNAEETRGSSFRFRPIHTGPTLRPRHIRQLPRAARGIPDPDVNLEVGSAPRPNRPPTTPRQDCRLVVDAIYHE